MPIVDDPIVKSPYPSWRKLILNNHKHSTAGNHERAISIETGLVHLQILWDLGNFHQKSLNMQSFCSGWSSPTPKLAKAWRWPTGRRRLNIKVDDASVEDYACLLALYLIPNARWGALILENFVRFWTFPSINLFPDGCLSTLNNCFFFSSSRPGSLLPRLVRISRSTISTIHKNKSEFVISGKYASIRSGTPQGPASFNIHAQPSCGHWIGY